MRTLAARAARGLHSSGRSDRQYVPMRGEPAREEVAERDEVVCGSEQQAADKNRSRELSCSRELEDDPSSQERNKRAGGRSC
jgi:hypothetical protein